MRSRRILIAAALAALVTGTLAGPTTAQDTEPDAAQTAAGGFETWFEQTPITDSLWVYTGPPPD